MITIHSVHRNMGKGERSKTLATEKKGKGKEKETASEIVQPDEEPPLTSTRTSPELEEEEGDDQAERVNLKDGEEDAIEEDNVEQEDDQAKEEEEAEELVDTMALEEEEIQKDNQGLEENDND